MDGLRRRGGATLAQAYLSHKREEIELSIRKRFENSDTDEEAQQHLVSANDEFLDETEEETSLATKESQFTFLTRVVLFVASCGIIFNVLVMLGVGVIASSVIGLGVAITVAVVQLKMEDLETLREVHNWLRRDVNVFSVENRRLGLAIDEMNTKVTSLRGTEQHLEEIASGQKVSVSNLVELVQQNAEILAEKKQVIRDDLIADLMDVVLKGERDQSGDFSDAEIQRLLRYMRGLPAVRINEELLTKTIKANRSMLSLMNLVRDIGRAGIQTGDNIFCIDDDDNEFQTRFISFD